MKVKRKIFYLLTTFILILTGCIGANNEENILDEDKAYYSLEDVSAYLSYYEKLPNNYLTKEQALDLGWEPSLGNLWEVTDKAVIGGDYFGNYEGNLPDASYKEADVNYDGGRRGSERIVYDDDFNIYYTKDHYETFERIIND
ncbi:MAG: ribonuclease domain-containing protein [Anaerococcus sp.]|nr:ribonuclease domain-containing protein [Anaerococcus sp.]